MALKFSNNANSTLASGIGSGDLSFTVGAGHGARFPSYGGGDYSYITLIDNSNNKEIVKVTARTGDVFTIPSGGRGLDGTSAAAFGSGSKVELRVPRIALEEFQLISALITQLGAYIPVTGDVKFTLRTTVDTGWVPMNDGSIGSAASGASTRANADTEPLYTLLYNNVSNTFCPVSGGRGANAAADFAANKTLTLTRAAGRALGIYGSGTGLTTRVLGEWMGAEGHVLTQAETPVKDHTHGITDPTHAHDVNRYAFISPQSGSTSQCWVNDAIVQSSFSATGITINTAGDATASAHSSMQPTLFMNALIKL